MAMKILYWFTRILAILSILFMMMFALDEFGGNEPLIRQLMGFLKHNIPVFALILALIIGWKYEIVGGVIFIIVFIALGILFKSFSGNTSSLIIIAPFCVVGILLILHQVLVGRSNGKTGSYST
jgi:hypothetical protein